MIVEYESNFSVCGARVSWLASTMKQSASTGDGEALPESIDEF